MTKLQQINALIDWAEVGQIVLHGLITLAVLTYLAGWYLGRWLHRANDQLSRAWVQLWVPGAAETVHTPDPLHCNGSAPGAAESVHTPNPQPQLHPLAALATELQQLSAAELRQLLGTKRRCSKAELVAWAMAC